MSNRKKAIPNFFILIILVAGIAWVCGRFLRISSDEYTDNAQVKQHLTPVNTRVQGFIKKIYFEEYQKVKKGDTLVVIEDIEYRLKVAQAEADYHNALVGKNAMYTTINTTQNNILVTDAAIDEQRIRLENAETDYKRYQELVKEEAVTPQQFDRVRTDYAATKARYEQLIRQKQSTSLVKQEQTQRLEQNEAAIKLAEAALELAKLNLSYTVILATTDGVTGRKEIHEGELVQQGQTLVTLVDGTEKWVIANYKETQTTNMHIGQKVKINVDAIPGVRFEGKISSISDATGSAYSIIPQDNSAGNFVKVEQRIPIRIEFTSENKKENLERLRAGMNVEKGYGYCSTTTHSIFQRKSAYSAMRLLLILFRTGFSVQRWCIPTHRTTDVKRAWVYQGRCIHGRLCLIHRNDHNLPYPFPTEIPIYNTQHTPHRMPCTDSVQPYHHAHEQYSSDDCGMFHFGFLPHVGNI